jgi:hypothetical protein
MFRFHYEKFKTKVKFWCGDMKEKTPLGRLSRSGTERHGLD